MRAITTLSRGAARRARLAAARASPATSATPVQAASPIANIDNNVVSNVVVARWNTTEAVTGSLDPPFFALLSFFPTEQN